MKKERTKKENMEVGRKRKGKGNISKERMAICS
jgi:hypothetical protein